MSEVEEKTVEPEDIWHAERMARVESERARIEAERTQVSSEYAGIEARWQELEKLEEKEKEDWGDIYSVGTKKIENEKQSLGERAKQLTNSWNNLSSQEQAVQLHAQLTDYDSLLQASSEPSQMMLRAYKEKLQDNPGAIRKLLFEHSRAMAKQIRPDSREYFAHLEEAMGFAPEDRKTDDFFQKEPKQSRERKSKEAPRVSLEQLQMAEDCGISKNDVLEAMNKSTEYDPHDTSHVYLDPNDSVDVSNEPAMEVRFEEPAKPERRYKSPENSPTAIKLSREEKELCEHMAVTINRPLNEVITSFAKEKLALHSGKSGHQLYKDKHASSVPSRNR